MNQKYSFVAFIFVCVGLVQGLKINGVSQDDAPKKVSPSSLLQASDAFAAIKDAGSALLKGDHSLAKKAGKTAVLATVGTIMKGAAKVGGMEFSEDDMNAAIHKAQNSKELHNVLDNFFKGINVEDLKEIPQTVSLLQQQFSEEPHKVLNKFAAEKKKKHEELKKQAAEKKQKHQEEREAKIKATKEEHEKIKAQKKEHHEEVKATKQQHQSELHTKIKGEMKAIR